MVLKEKLCGPLSAGPMKRYIDQDMVPTYTILSTHNLGKIVRMCQYSAVLIMFH